MPSREDDDESDDDDFEESDDEEWDLGFLEPIEDSPEGEETNARHLFPVQSRGTSGMGGPESAPENDLDQKGRNDGTKKDDDGFFTPNIRGERGQRQRVPPNDIRVHERARR